MGSPSTATSTSAELRARLAARATRARDRRGRSVWRSRPTAGSSATSRPGARERRCRRASCELGIELFDDGRSRARARAPRPSRCSRRTCSTRRARTACRLATDVDNAAMRRVRRDGSASRFEGVLRGFMPMPRRAARLRDVRHARATDFEDVRARMDLEQADDEVAGRARGGAAAGRSRATTRRSSPSTCCSRCSSDPEGVVLPAAARVGCEPERSCATAWTRRSTGCRRSTRRAREVRISPATGAAARGRGARGRGAHRRVRLDRAPAARAARRRRHDRARGLLRRGRAHARRRARRARRGARAPARHRARTPRTRSRSLEKYGRDLTEQARARQARPGDRPRRGGPPHDPGALAPHEEQPRADRRAGRRQDRDRRGARAADRGRRRARVAEGQAADRARPRRDGRRARSTAASSRSG